MSKKIAVISSVHDIRDPRVTLKISRSLSKKYETHLIGGFNDTEGNADHFRENFLGEIIWHPIRTMLSKSDRLARHIEIYSHLKTIHPDVLYINDPELFPLGLLVRSRLKTKIIMDFHEDTFDPYFAKNVILQRLAQSAFTRSDAIVTAFELDLRPYHPRPIVPHIELLNFYPESYSDQIDRTDLEFAVSKPNLLFTGTIHKNRGLHYLLDVIEKMKGGGQDMNCIVAGRCFVPSNWRWFLQEIDQRNLGEEFQLIGGRTFVDWFTIQKLQRSSTLGSLLYPVASLNWQFPTKCYEFMANRLPYLMTPVPSFRTFHEKFGGGIELNFENEEITNESLENLIQLPNKRPEFKNATSVPTWESQETKLYDVIEEITS